MENKLKLTEKEQKILSCVEFSANASVKDIQQQTGFQSHSIQYALQKLQDRGIIKKTTFIDAYRLGIKDYAFYFSFSSESNTQKEKILQYLQNSPKVAWIGGLGGDYQFGAAIYVQSIGELLAFLDQLSILFGDVFLNKSVTLRAEFIRFPKKYLHNENTQQTKEVYFGNENIVATDELDKNILRELGNTSLSIQGIAQKLQIPTSTVYKRVKKLEEKKVITGYIYTIDSLQLGMHTFQMLLFTKGLHKGLRNKLYSFAKKHQFVVQYVRTIGEWDYELTVELPRSEMLHDFVQELYDTFGEQIKKTSVLPLFQYYKESYFPG